MHSCINRGKKIVLREEQGFSFVELMISIAILSMVTIALVALINMNTVVAARAENKSRITDAMAQLADQLRLMPFNDVGKVLTYTADGGHIIMNLSVSTNTDNKANAKVVEIEGRSSRLDPNNVERLTVILKSVETAIPPGGTEPPAGSSLQDFVINENQEFGAAKDGDTLWGTITLDAIIPRNQATPPPQSVRMYANGTQVYQKTNPDWWENHRVFLTDTESKFPDGVLHLRAEVINAEGGFEEWDRWVTLDNHAPATSFPDITPNVTTAGGISASWDIIPDPAGTMGSPAMRYKTVLITKKSNGQLISTEEKIITNSAPNLAAETTVNFDTAYKKNQVYELYVYVMCPPNCKHALWGSPTVSTPYLYRKF